MSKIVRVSQGNYKLQVQSDGIIRLDTGALVGQVHVTGDLKVDGIFEGDLAKLNALELRWDLNSNLNTRLTGSAPLIGGTGLYFVNSDNTSGDEFVSRRRALAFSMIF